MSAAVNRSAGLLALLLVFASCAHAPQARSPDDVDVLVIAPHPDDEVLLAGGAMQRAIAAHQRVAVVVMTNGDYTCERDGYLREAESVAALKAIGVQERDIYFLGYPDGALVLLSREPLPPREFRDATGQCIAQTRTWADTRNGRDDVHERLTGAAGEWTSIGITEDLAMLLSRLDPHDVYLPHAIDDHPDHAMTYVYFRRALDLLNRAPAVVHRGVVHAGPCWPSANCSVYYEPDSAMPPLPKSMAEYLPNERTVIDAEQKLALITNYHSQTGPQPRADWLASFARKEEVYFDERYVRVGGHWVQAESSPGTPGERALAVGEFIEWNRWGPDGFSAAGVRRKDRPVVVTPARAEVTPVPTKKSEASRSASP